MRRTVTDLAGEAQVGHDLARTAIARGRRMRVRRQAGLAAAVVLAVAAVATPFVLVNRSGTPNPPASAPPTPPVAPAPSSTSTASVRRIALDGGWVVTGADGWVLNGLTGEYIQIPASQSASKQPASNPGIVPSPTGNLVAVQTGDTIAILGPDGRPQRQVTRSTNGQVSWSAQGDRLLAGWIAGFTVIDAHTGQQHDFPIDRNRYPCSECRFVFTRDGAEVALAIPNLAGGEAHDYVKQVQLFSASTGKPTRTLKITAMPTSPFSWSPDGRKVIALADGVLRNSAQLIDLTTGQATPLPADAVWADAHTLLSVGQWGVTTLRPDGTVVREMVLEEPLTNHFLLSIGPGQ